MNFFGLTLSPCTVFLNFGKKTGNFTLPVCCAAANYYNKGGKKMLDFSQNFMHTRMNLLPASKNQKKLSKI